MIQRYEPCEPLIGRFRTAAVIPADRAAVLKGIVDDEPRLFLQEMQEVSQQILYLRRYVLFLKSNCSVLDSRPRLHAEAGRVLCFPTRAYRTDAMDAADQQSWLGLSTSNLH